MAEGLTNYFALFLASLLVGLLTYLKVSISTFQQITALLVVFLLIFSSRYTSLQKIKFLNPKVLTSVLLFSLSFFVQILTISTGAFFSPFLILLHLFALATSFLISFRVALAFTFFSVLVITTNTLLNPDQLQFVKEDLGSVLIYGISLIVIIPLSQIIASRYHFKDELSKILFQKVMVGEAILENLSELILITNKRLEIISANEALKRMLQKNTEIIGKNFFDVLILKDANGIPADIKSLSIDKVLSEKSTRFIGGFLLYAKSRSTPYKITIQIRPIIGSNGEVEQISFILTGGHFKSANDLAHSDLEKAVKIRQFRQNQIQDYLKKIGQTKVNADLELLNQQEQDLLIAKDLEDHPLEETNNLVDIAYISKKTVSSKQALASGLNIPLEFRLNPEDSKELAILSLKESDYSQNLIPTSDYAIPSNSKWLEVLINKLLDLAILLASDDKNPKVEISPLSTPDKKVSIVITATCSLVSKQEQDLLFTEYYGNLAEKTNLKLGSGLEGFIAKSVAAQLDIPLEVKFSKNPPLITFLITINRAQNSNLNS